MYDFLNMELIKKCIKGRFHLIERNLSYEDVIKAIECCYAEGIFYRGSIYKTKSGGPTGHPITSVIQNIVMSSYEIDVFKPEIDARNIQQYYRWVDDMLNRVKTSEISVILDNLNSYDPIGKLKFTVEKASLDDHKYELPFLDIRLKWNTTNGKWSTAVYRKPTTSRIVMPYNSFAPQSWKTGTLVYFLRRAYTNCSNYKEMHEEIKEERGN